MSKSKIHGVGHLQLLISEIFQGILFFRKSQQNRQKSSEHKKIDSSKMAKTLKFLKHIGF